MMRKQLNIFLGEKMRVILLDDEELLLRDNKRLLGDFSDVEVISVFTDPLAAIKFIENNKNIDCIFSDISMPGMNGLSFAERVTEIAPEIEIVFITAYDEYAIKAFELSAFDYLLKPVNKNRLAKTISRLRLALSEKAPPMQQKGIVQVRFFGRFDLKIAGVAVKWRSKKAEELFAYMADNAGKPIHKIILIDNLWPDMDERAALVNLQTTVCRTRSTLAPAAGELQLAYSNDCYRLVVNNWQTDIDELNSELHKSHPDRRVIQALYQDGYLAENGWLWSYAKAGNWDEKLVDYIDDIE